MLRRRSLAKLRREVEPVDQPILGRFTTKWHGVVTRRQGADALVDAIEQLQGAPLAASILETEILPARIESYDPADLDAITAAGEIVWVGLEALGERDGRMALYLADHLPRLLPPQEVWLQSHAGAELDARESTIVDYLREHGASFFGPLHEALGGGYPAHTVDTLWTLVWKGLVTNDTFHALRSFTRARAPQRKARRADVPAFRSRRLAPPGAEGRWSLVRSHLAHSDAARRAGGHLRRPDRAALHAASKWAAALTGQLLARHGVLTREAVMAEAIPGGFGTVYPVLKAMEETGRLRRGYFVAGLGATQFALPGAVDLLRSVRVDPDDPEVAVLAATDPANPYGATLKWPATMRGAEAGRGPTRTIGATVILVDGALAAYLARGDRLLLTFLPEAEPQHSRTGGAVARALILRARSGGESPRGMLIEEIDGLPPSTHPMASYLAGVGFISGALGFHPSLDSF